MTAGRRDQLAEALQRLGGPREMRRCDDPYVLNELAPVVDRMIRQAQAEALESAAEVAHLAPMRAADLIRARAVALRPTTDHMDVTQDGPRTPSEPP